MFAVFGTSKA